jgi:hypothetical protein
MLIPDVVGFVVVAALFQILFQRPGAAVMTIGVGILIHPLLFTMIR